MTIASYAELDTMELSAALQAFRQAYPTGIGALLARKVSLRKLQRPWFAGGTISIASVL